MVIPEKYRERYDRLALSHPWMREMRDEQPQEGDAVAILRKWGNFWGAAHSTYTQCDSNWEVTTMRALADMIERDYVRRDKHDDAIRLKLIDIGVQRARCNELERERDELKVKCKKQAEVLDLQQDLLNERDYVRRDDYDFMVDALKFTKEERDKLQGRIDTQKRTIMALKDGLRDVQDERDEWKAKAEGSSEVRVGSSKRAAAVERLKNRVGARFNAESIVVALTGGRLGQGDWSLECDSLIHLLTDDDGAGRGMTNLEWFMENDFERLRDQMSGQPCSCCVVGCPEDLGSEEACSDALREWLMSEHVDANITL